MGDEALAAAQWQPASSVGIRPVWVGSVTTAVTLPTQLANWHAARPDRRALPTPEAAEFPIRLARRGAVLSVPAMAPRLRQVPRAEVTSPVVLSMYKRLFDDRDPVAEPGTATGTPGNWWTVFANSPDVLEHAGRGFGLYAGPDRKVPGALRELGQTRAGWLVGSQFVFSQHCKACHGYGFSDEKIEALKAWQVSDLFDPLERALLAYTDALGAGIRARRSGDLRRDRAISASTTSRSSSSRTSR